MNNRHDKFMRNVFGPESPEERRARQGQIECELRSDIANSRVDALETAVISLRVQLGLFISEVTLSRASRDKVGTLHVNISSLRDMLDEYERELQAYLDLTRK